jgi:hypothetical protein
MKYVTGVFVLGFLALMGQVGSMDYADAVKEERYKCEMINNGSWGADYETRQRCKLTKGE